MKNKLFYILLMLFTILSITACNNKKEESEENEVNFKQDITILKSENDEILEGVLEGYTFKVTEEETDRVRIQMEDGSVILVVLSNKQTPITIANFKKLVSEGFYDGIIFHRVIENFMIQGGDPTGTGYSGSEETIKGEFSSNGITNDLSHTRGVISMARSNDPNSASSQFFIVHADSTYLDGDYAAFGKVFAGMDAVDNIATTKTDEDDKPLTDQKIKSIKFINIAKE